MVTSYLMMPSQSKFHHKRYYFADLEVELIALSQTIDAPALGDLAFAKNTGSLYYFGVAQGNQSGWRKLAGIPIN